MHVWASLLLGRFKSLRCEKCICILRVLIISIKGEVLVIVYGHPYCLTFDTSKLLLFDDRVTYHSSDPSFSLGCSKLLAGRTF